MIFELSHQEVIKFENWKKKLPKLEEVDIWGEEFQYEFIFYPTGLGTVKKIRRTDGEEMNLTEYSKW